jgi:uncharacterized protein YbcC (UPF0753/DUF2309 family)
MTQASYKTPRVPAHAPVSGSDGHASLDELEHAIEHATHLLPSQGPITVFIHHNTLHAFEDLPFHEAVVKGARIFGCDPYLTEDRYREELRRGRIRLDELRSILREHLGERADEPILPHGTRLDLRLAMVEYPLRSGPTEELLWFVAQTDALRRVRCDACPVARGALIAETRRWVLRDLRGGTQPHHRLGELLERFGESTLESWDENDWESFALQALWRVCSAGIEGAQPQLVPAAPPAIPIRHRDLLLEATGADSDLLVHDVLIRFCAAFLDQGLAHWELPLRDEGLSHAFAAVYRQPGGSPSRWLRGLAGELDRLLQAGWGPPLESIRESLETLGVRESEYESFLSATLLALRGWAGMIRQIEEREDRVVHPIGRGSLVEFLALRLILDRLALAHTARETLGFTGPLDALRDELRQRTEKAAQSRWPSVTQRAFLVFQLAQVLGWTPAELYRLNNSEWATLVREIEAFSAIERRQIFHLAYEHRFNTRALDAVALHSPRRVAKPAARPRFQAVFCIDEREESIRRHIEELAPDAETLSTAGFYSIAMYFRGAADAHFVPLCPAVIRPKHWVTEEVVERLEDVHRQRARRRRALGMASHQFHVGSRSFALGAVLTTAVGVLASIPLIAGTLFPRLTSRIRKRFGRIVQIPPLTRLQLERTDPTPGPQEGRVGFTLDELTAIGEKVLRELGLTLTSRFSRLVLTFGHGSTSMNNPHESAHDCGACGGARGGPNGRAIAQILNDPRIRERLAQHGLVIPHDTVFIGGMHNTSSEAITFADIDRIPESHRAEFESVRALIEESCNRDAHERSRRFLSAPRTLSFAAARQHVEGRAVDLAQVRPEWGHATNALCIVGRRERTRGLFLDRRAFLTSYDPTQDDAEATVLSRILAAVFPVCAGISLEYYFSYVDNPGFGSGTKLPHNITSLLGVMDGAASDLRTGLPWQMVEIHEPVRLLCIIETTPEVMLRIMERDAGIDRLVRNGWVYLAVQDPHSQQLQVFRDGAFYPYQPLARSLPTATSSVEWYGGWREHLEFASIGSSPSSLQSVPSDPSEQWDGWNAWDGSDGWDD